MALDPAGQVDPLARLVERNWAAAWASLSRARATPPTFAEELDSCLRVFTPGAPETLLNMVIGYHSANPVTMAEIEGVIAPFRQWRLPFQWWYTRGSEPAGMRQRLSALGMESWGGATMMALPLGTSGPTALSATRYPSLPGGVTLDRVMTPEDAEAALAIICEVFYIPQEPMRRWTTLNPAFDLWIARLGARPVATLATLADGDTTGVYHVATLPGARRRGIAGNLLLQALRDALAQGSRWATLTATPEARALYERLGFRACGLIEQWMPGFALNSALTGGYDDVLGRV
ncbi:MAG TPA: GNAT family N-acetyltransferase [Ktedonobacterales bacterium]